MVSSILKLQINEIECCYLHSQYIRINETKAESFFSVNYVNVNYSVKYSTVNCKYLLFLQDILIGLIPKPYKKCQYCRFLKKSGNHKTKPII